MQDKSICIMVDLSDVDPTTGFDLSISRPFTDFFETEDNLKAVGDMEANLHVTVSGDDYFVTGRAAGRMKAECGLCLKEYFEFIETGINAPFIPKDAWEEAEAGSRGREAAEAAEEVVMGDAGDSNVYYYEGNGLELYTLLRDQLLLSMPVKQVCSEECKGLCQRCGTDLNVKSCGCPDKDADKRFAALEQLKDKLKK